MVEAAFQIIVMEQTLFRAKVGDTPQDKCAEELEQDDKKVVQKEPPTDQRLANMF